MGMDQRSVRVVVGQGDRARGDLRDVLTDDGFLVVGEAATVSELARVLRDAQPDVIVLDDSIGVAAAQLAAELSPRAKLVVIWPAAVMPIAGAARVDPGEVGMALSATVGLVAGLSGLGSIERPEWIDKVRKDPAALRAKLASSGAAPVRPSVTELQRRGQRLHPSPGAGRRRSRSARAAAVAAGTLSLASTEATTGAGAAPAAGGTLGATDALVSRRIGMIALGGAAVAGALMIALSFGPNRSPGVITAVRFVPPIGGPIAGPPTTTDPTPTGDGQNPGPTTPPPTDGGTTPTSPPTSSPPSSLPPAGGAGGPAGSGGTGGGGSGGGTGGGGSTSLNALAAVAGSSVAHNPHGGAPGLKDSGSAAQNPQGGPPGLTNDAGGGHGPNGPHAGGHTPHGDHPAHPVHTHKR